MQSKKVTLNGIEMLYGSVDEEQLYFDYPDWRAEEKKCRLFEPALTELKSIPGKFRVELFIGTWCGDSKREAPRFFKIIREARLADKIAIEMWAVDHNKKLDNNLAAKRNIDRVPTFIFYKEGQEIGRIVEYPEELLEQDILSMLKTSGKD